jgi:tRNA modification GTPase
MPAAAGIFRQLTPPGEGGIAVFAVEGPGARAALLAAVRSARLAALRPGELAYGRLAAADGATLDEVIVACLPAIPAHQPCPQVERFELSCHAGGAAAAAAAGRLAELGLVPGEPCAEPGLTGLERDFRSALSDCRTRRQLEALVTARAALPAALDRVRTALRPPTDLASAERLLFELREESWRLGRLLATHRVALAGPVNAGKSTLFNRLAGSDLAIASPHPGTTRDTIETALAVRGLAVDLVDTAGLGPEAGGELARRAQQQGRERAAGVELLLLVLDSSRAPDSEADAALAELTGRAGRTLIALNKCDLAPAEPPASLAGLSSHPALRVSALTGQGLPELLAAVEEVLLPDAPRGAAAATPGEAAAALLDQAYTCVRRAAMNNDPAAAAEAAERLEAGLEADV